jgi:hypothetical protein
MNRWSRRATAGGAVSLFLAAMRSMPIAATASCDGHECDPSTTDYGCDSAECCTKARNAGMGMIQGPGGGWYWQSSPTQAADWLAFPAMGTVNLRLAGWTDAMPDPAFSCILIAPAPPQGAQAPDPKGDSIDAAVSDFTCASGILGQYLDISSGLVQVENATCSPWIARFVIGFDAPDGGGALPKGPCWKAQDSSGP